MSPRYLIFIVLIILVIACLPRWPYNAGWSTGMAYGGYGPAGGFGLVLVILVILLLFGFL